MKYKTLLFLSLIANLNAQNYTVFDSGWINNNPSLRSINELGLNIHDSFEQFRPQNKYLKPASYFIEYLVSDNVKTNIHELGHGKQIKYFGETPIYGDKYKNWWEYSLKRNITKAAFVSHQKESIEVFIAGINATTNFSEQNQGKLRILWDVQNRFSNTIYILLCKNSKFSNSDVNKIKEHWNYKYSDKHMIGSELLCFGISQLSSVQFYSYLTSNGISIRARQNNKNFNWAIESTTYKNNYNCEVFLSQNLKYNKDLKIKPELVIGLHGIGYNLSVEYKNFVIGYRNPNVKTLSGSRELNKELYFQIKM